MRNNGATMLRAIMMGVSIVVGAFSFSEGAARAADDAPDTAAVLQDLHHSNQQAVAAGKLAQQSGKSRAMKDYGKMLEKDHGAADEQVTALAREKKVNLTDGPSFGEMSDMAADPMFDTKFAQEMLGNHKKDLADVKDARDRTLDGKLKKLLIELVPTLQRHQDTAQKIIDTETKK
jgi:putative membrane protein